MNPKLLFLKGFLVRTGIRTAERHSVSQPQIVEERAVEIPTEKPVEKQVEKPLPKKQETQAEPIKKETVKKETVKKNPVAGITESDELDWKAFLSNV